MALIHDIQSALLDDNTKVSSALLKIRFLAAKIGSEPLEEWVKHETEGYPKTIDVPAYRVTGVAYRGTFTDGIRTLNNVSIPPHIIKSAAGNDWVRYSIREGIGSIEHIMNSNKHGENGLDAGNLKILLENKMYQGFTCLDAMGTFDSGSFSRIHHTVRAKCLDLALELERTIPAISDIKVGSSVSPVRSEQQDKITYYIENAVYGNLTNISQTDNSSSVTFNIDEGDIAGLIEALKKTGMSADAAAEIAQIAATETPDAPDKPLGDKARAWITEKVKQGASGALGVGKAVGTEILTEALKQFYGLK